MGGTYRSPYASEGRDYETEETSTMATTEIPDAEDVLAPYWPLHGPYDDDRTRAAAALLGEAVRYLNYATGQGAATALPWASTAASVVDGFRRAAALMDQTLNQLNKRIEEFAADPTLEDWLNRDNPDAAVQQAREAQTMLRRAKADASALSVSLGTAFSCLNRLGHRDA